MFPRARTSAAAASRFHLVRLGAGVTAWRRRVHDTDGYRYDSRCEQCSKRSEAGRSSAPEVRHDSGTVSKQSWIAKQACAGPCAICGTAEAADDSPDRLPRAADHLELDLEDLIVAEPTEADAIRRLKAAFGRTIDVA